MSTAAAGDREQTLKTELVARGAHILEELLATRKQVIRHAYFWVCNHINMLRQQGMEDGKLKALLANERTAVEKKKSKAKYLWYKGMQNVMGEVDQQTACIPKRGINIRFLDLG